GGGGGGRGWTRCPSPPPTRGGYCTSRTPPPLPIASPSTYRRPLMKAQRSGRSSEYTMTSTRSLLTSDCGAAGDTVGGSATIAGGAGAGVTGAGAGRMGAGAAAGAGGGGFASAALTFLALAGRAFDVFRADSVLDSIGTGPSRDFFSAETRGSTGTRGSADPGLSLATPAGGVAVGLGAAATAMGCVFGADTSCAGIHIQRAAAIAI